MVSEAYDGRLAGTTWTARDLGLPDALALAREAGLSMVEIWAEGVHLDPRTTGFRPDRIRRALGSDLEVVSVHLPFDGVAEGAPADSRSAEWVRLCADTLRRAAELGARTAVAHPVIYRDDEPEAVGNTRLTRALLDIAHAADRLGLRLAVENMHDLRGPTLRTVHEIVAALRDAPSSAGVCLDVGHAVFNGFTGPRLAAEVHAAGTRLRNTHVHDSDRVGNDPHLVPGEGIADWTAFLTALADIGYEGLFVLEVNGESDPLERLTTARSRFKQLLAAADFPGSRSMRA